MGEWVASVVKNFECEKCWSEASSVTFSSIPSAASGGRYSSTEDLFRQGNNSKMPWKWTF